jgi:hypothetical protein
MAEVTNDLIYEILKWIQSEVSGLRDDVREMKVRMFALDERQIALTHSLMATQTDIANIYSKASRSDRRLERIERRLDIVDEPAE